MYCPQFHIKCSITHILKYHIGLVKKIISIISPMSPNLLTSIAIGVGNIQFIIVTGFMKTVLIRKFCILRNTILKYKLEQLWLSVIHYSHARFAV